MDILNDSRFGVLIFAASLGVLFGVYVILRAVAAVLVVKLMSPQLARLALPLVLREGPAAAAGKLALQWRGKEFGSVDRREQKGA
jgi:uncharacterized membrane protein